MRADLYLVEQGLATSRAQAQQLIEAGHVFILDGNGTRQSVKKSNQKMVAHAKIEIASGNELERYVSRAGLKLEGALKHTGLDVHNALVLDIGISTGGFADCVLQNGARGVVGVDVGHDQLATKLRGDPRVHLLEGINARWLASATSKEQLMHLTEGQLFDLIVVDVSFISLSLILPELGSYLKLPKDSQTTSAARVLALVKPQFEVGREGLSKNGIVKDAEKWSEVETKIRKVCDDCGLQTEDYFESTITGGDGNKEFFIYCRLCPHP